MLISLAHIHPFFSLFPSLLFHSAPSPFSTLSPFPHMLPLRYSSNILNHDMTGSKLGFRESKTLNEPVALLRMLQNSCGTTEEMNATVIQLTVHTVHTWEWKGITLYQCGALRQAPWLSVSIGRNNSPHMVTVILNEYWILGQEVSL